MLTLARTRLRDDEDGFTLIELMVVVLIIAILLAIAIPTFLGAQDRARDRGAQSDLRNGITAAKTIATDNAGELDEVTVDELNDAEGAITFDTAAVNTDTVQVQGGGAAAVAVADWIQLSTESESGTVYSIATASTGEVGYCSWEAGGAAIAAGFAADALTGCIEDEF